MTRAAFLCLAFLAAGSIADVATWSLNPLPVRSADLSIVARTFAATPALVWLAKAAFVAQAVSLCWIACRVQIARPLVLSVVALIGLAFFAGAASNLGAVR